MGVKIGRQRTVLAHVAYPKEGNPLWEQQYSTQAVAHTFLYSKFHDRLPLSQCASVHGPVLGMEYPMICFNGAAPNEDGTYSAHYQVRRLISVIIHEVGHNFFPMIVNTDERQWTWMDEGMNTFLPVPRRAGVGATATLAPRRAPGISPGIMSEATDTRCRS